MLDELRRTYDLSILFSTHDFATLEQYADKVILLQNPVRALKPDGARMGQLPQNGLEQGGLARPVGPDESGDFPAVEVEGHLPQQHRPGDGLRRL